MIGKKCGPSEATLKVKDLQRLTVKHFVNVVWTSAWKSNQCTKAIFIPDSFPDVFVVLKGTCVRYVPSLRPLRAVYPERQETRQRTNQLLFSLLTKIQTHIYLGNTTFKPTCWFLFVTLRDGPLRKGGVGGSDTIFQGKIFFQCQIVQECFFFCLVCLTLLFFSLFLVQ